MTFDPNVPEFPSDTLNVTQPELFDNFAAIFNAFLVNHIPLNEANQGNHTIIQLIEQLNDPQTNSNDLAVYTKDAPGQTDQIFMKFQKNGQVFQFTNYQIYSIFAGPTQSSYFTFLPGRIIVYFGSFTSLPNNNQLNLIPPIATNIITVSQVPTGLTLANKANVSLLRNGAGLYNAVLFKTGLLNIALPSNYLIMANV